MQDPKTRIHRAIASLQRLAELFGERRRQLAAEVGLSENQWRLLDEVAGEDFMPSMFARRRDCTPAAVSRGLKGLLDRGLVEVSIAEGDARQRIYRLTRRGRSVLRQLRTKRERAVAEIWQRFRPAELDAFVHFADELSDHLEAYARRTGSASGRGSSDAASP